MQLFALLESIEKNVTGLNKTNVIYRSSNNEFELGYDIVKKNFPEINYVRQKNAPYDFMLLLHTTFKNIETEYFMFAVDDIIVTDSIKLGDCIENLEETNAYGFFLRLGLNITENYTVSQNCGLPPIQEIKPGIYSWKFSYGAGDWGLPISTDMTVYRKKNFENFIFNTKYIAPNDMEKTWLSMVPNDSCGICYKHSKIINIPLNVVQMNKWHRSMNLCLPEELLEKFLDGYKIDVSKFQEIQNKSPHEEHIPKFVKIDKLNVPDLIIFSYDRPMQLFALLESIEKYGIGLGKINILYRTSDNDFDYGYEFVMKSFPYANFYKQFNPPDDFGNLLYNVMFEDSKSEYFLFAVDDLIMTGEVNFQKCVNLLKKTKSFGFYLRLGLNINKYSGLNHNVSLPDLKKIKNRFFSWNLMSGIGPWGMHISTDMVIYSKEFFKELIKSKRFYGPNSLEILLLSLPKNIIGICFESSKVVNLSLNIVRDKDLRNYASLLRPDELLNKFIERYKIDIDSVLISDNTHEEYIPKLIKF